MAHQRASDVTVTFAERAFSLEEALLHSQWRLLTDYERGILDRLLTVDFPGRDSVLAAVDDQVRQVDRCGCIEFKSGTEATGEHTIVAEGSGPAAEQETPLEVMLTVRAGRPLWLEFHRYGGRNDFFPAAAAFEVREFR